MQCRADPKGRSQLLQGCHWLGCQRWQDPSSSGYPGPSVALNHDWLVDSGGDSEGWRKASCSYQAIPWPGPCGHFTCNYSVSLLETGRN